MLDGKQTLENTRDWKYYIWIKFIIKLNYLMINSSASKGGGTKVIGL